MAQQDEMALIDKIEQLTEQLKSEKISERDAAQQELLKIGTQVLDYLEASDSDTSDFRSRVAAIRQELEKRVVKSVSEPSRVSLSGTMTVEQALEQIRKATGNVVELDIPQLLEKTVKFDGSELTFWEALDAIGRQAGLEVDRYGGGPGVLKLGPTIAGATSDQPNRVPVVYSKIFRTQVARVQAAIDLTNPELDSCMVNVLIRWEPRLRPISIDLPLSDVDITDEYGDTVRVKDPNMVVYGVVQPELPELEFSVPIERVSRQVEELTSMTLKLNAILPGRNEAFRFRNVSDQRAGLTQTRAGATVTFGGVRRNEDIYMITLSLSFDEEHNALESHQGWVFQNEVYLEDAKGEREESIGLETVQQDNSKVTIRYLFINDPGQRTLIYKTPAAIVRLPVTVELKKIPLP